MHQNTVVTFPSIDLLEAVGPLPTGIHAAIWDFLSDPVGVALDDVEIAIFPYIAKISDLQAATGAPNLKLVQTQSTGFDGIRELVGPNVSVATAHGVHAAATAELAIGLALASLRGIGESLKD